MSAPVAIVSGAARGLGLAFANRLAREGYAVLPCDVDSSVTELPNGLVADVSRQADVESVIARAVELGPVEVLINNAGTWRRTPVDSSWEDALADW